MSGANVWGAAVSGAHVEQAIVKYLTEPDPVSGGTWLSTGLAEAEAQHGLERLQLQRPLAVVTAAQFETMPEDQIPCILVLCPGLAAPPARQGRGAVSMTWAVGVAALVSDVDVEATRLIGQVYALGISLAMNAKRSLGGFATKTEQVDERYDDLDFGDGRTLGAGRCVFEVTVASARQLGAGPSAPLPEPDPDNPGGPNTGTDPGPWPDVTETSISVEPKPITEAVS